MTEPAVSYLYRQRMPAAAPQAVQLLATAHALARAGIPTYLQADMPIPASQVWPPPAAPLPAFAPPQAPFPPHLETVGAPGSPPSLQNLLLDHGLLPAAGLEVRWMPASPRLLAGAAFRLGLLRWLAACRRTGRAPVILSRRVDYAAAWLPWARALGFRLVHEWHYQPSVNAAEAGNAVENKRFLAFEQQVLAQASLHLCVSPLLAGQLRPLASSPVLCLPNGGPPPQAGLAEGLQEGMPPRVVYAGLIRRPTDVDPLLSLAADPGLGAQVVLVGGDEEGNRLKAVLSRAPQRLLVTGPLSPEVSRGWLRAGTVGVASFAPSENMRLFACPLKILEYQAAGLPLVASDFPTVRALVEDGVDGLLVPPEEPEALARAVKRLLEDRGLARRLASRGLERAAQRTWIRRGSVLAGYLRVLVAGERLEGTV